MAHIMSTTYSSKKRVTSAMAGTTHTLPILMSKLRVSLEYAWEQAGARFLRPFSSKRAELERRIFVFILLMMIVGVVKMSGQTQPVGNDFSGTYFIANHARGNYNSSNYTDNFYLCPSTNMYAEDQPLLTTYRERTANPTNAKWTIKYATTENNVDYYYLIHSSDKYLTWHEPMTISDNGNPTDRVRLHLQSSLNESKALFYFTEGNKGDNDYNICLKGVNCSKNTVGSLNPAKDNVNDYQGIKSNWTNVGSFIDPIDGTTKRWCGGLIGIYEQNDATGVWYLEDYIQRPAISYSGSSGIEITNNVTGATVYYTTDGTDPKNSETSFTRTSTVLPSFTDGTVIKAVSKIGEEYSNVATFTAYVHVGNSNPYVIQTVDGGSFYLVPPITTETNVTTTNIPHEKMAWYFMDAGQSNGVQYYYIVNDNTNEYLYCSGGKSETNAFVMKAPNADGTESTRYRFMFVPSGEGLCVIPEKFATETTGMCMSKKNGNNATDYLNLSDGTDDYSRWMFIARPDNPKTLFDNSFASSSTDSKYYKIQNANSTHNIIPPTTAGGNATTKDNATGDNTMWYFVPTADGDSWVEYYNIRNGLTGEYLYFNGTAGANNTVFTSSSIITGNENQYKFIVVKGASSDYPNAYNIIPYALKDQANQVSNSLNRNGTTLRTQNSRNTPASLWNLVDGEYTVAPPYITYDVATNTATISCTYPGATIYYTTNGTEATVSSTHAIPTDPNAFELTAGITTIRAIASKDVVGTSAESTYNNIVQVTKSSAEADLRPYLIQSKQCQFYNLIPNTSIDETTKYVSTLNVPCETMAWHFEYAEEGYYYVVDKNGWYLYYTTTDNSNNYVYLKSSKDESDDGFKFSITAHASGGFNLIPKGPTKSINKSNYGGSNAGLTPAKIAGNIGDANSRWDIIPYSTTNLTQWATAPFENISDDSHTYYYKIVSVSQSTKPIILNNDGDVKSQVPPTGIDERKTMWVIKEAVTDGLLHYYTFQNAYTGELLYYNGNGRNKTTNSFQLGQPEVEGANAQWSHFVIVQTETGYNIIPRPIVDNTKAINTTGNNEAFNCINRAGGNDVLGTYYDDGNGSRWTFSQVEAAVKCMDPVFGEDAEGNITITSTTNAAKIRYTENGEDPTTESDVYTTLLPASQKKCIKAIAIIGEDAGSMSEVVTLLNCPDIDLDVDNYVYNKTAKEPAVTKVYIGDVVATAGTYSAPVYTNNTNAGTEIVKPTVTITDAVADDRLVIANAKKEFVIQPLEVTLNWANTTLTYNRSAQTPTATVTNCIEGDECNVTVAVEGETSHTDVGDYTAIAQSLDNTNYALPTENTMAFSIIRKSIGDGTSLAAGFSVTMGDGDNPTFTVKDGTEELIKDTEYEVSDPVTEDGNQVWTISGIGNYTGSTKLMRIALTFNETGEESGHQEHDVTPYQASADMTIAGLHSYIVTHINMTKRTVAIQEINYVPKDEPVLLLTDLTGETTNFTATPLHVAEGDKADTSGNLLQVSPEGGKAVGFGEVYMYYEGKFVMTTGGTLPEGKFYLKNPNPPSSSGGGGTSNAPLRIVIDDTTDMEDVKTMMEDEREGHWYTLDGRRLNGKPTKKGLYLKEGKKIVIK